MIVYSVDPSTKRHQIAAWDDGVFVGMRTAGMVREIITGCDRDYVRLVVEDQFVGAHRSGILRLARAAGHLVGSLGLEIDEAVWVRPVDWKRGLCRAQAPKVKDLGDYLVHRRILEVLSADERAQYSTALDGEKSKVRRFDIADATGIGLYHLDRT